ncbi:MAG TPA: MMPL family transporter [Solirubrobacterales bacterium]|nr:MMPL family transporter [Solirubrobacterales bacterium]
MTAPLYAIGRWCSRHHWPVIGAWIVAAVALVIISSASGSKTSENLTLPGTGSTTSTELLEANLPEQAYGSNPLVLEAPAGTKLTEAKYAKAVEETVANLEKLPDVNSAMSPLAQGSQTLSQKDPNIGYIPVVLGVGPSEMTEAKAQDILDTAKPFEAAGGNASVGAYVGQQLSKPDTGISDAIGLAAAVIILLFAFGTATAMMLPIVSAVLGLACALSIIKLLEHVLQVPGVAATLATMIGLGVGIDYALFIVTRHKLQLAEGIELRESIARATATAGGAVVFAGFTVVIALCSLLVADIPLVTTLGFTAAISVVVAVLAAVTLLPAMLGALGPHINSLRVHLGKTHPDDAEPHGWRRWAERVADAPWRSAIVALLILIILALPIFKLDLGQNDISALPEDTTSRQAYNGLNEGFGPGVNGPLLIASEFTSPEEAQKVLPGLQKSIGGTQDVAAVTEPTLSEDKKVAVFTVISKSEPWADETVSLVENLRDEVIPGALAGTKAQSYVGGQTAGYIDLANQIADKLPLMIIVVIALSFLVLLMAFRSILVPIKAAAMNLLSVAASYGVVTAVFQLGWGSSLIGLDHAIPIVSFVPLMMFAILFGLSMDYEVFLLTQMKEHYVEYGDEKRAVIEGVANTGRVITSAASIMVCVFLSFVLNSDPVVKEFGVGLAVAIAIDSTIVRCLLVPAVMTLLGAKVWWMPKWLERWVPNISIEGEEFFEARDKAAAADASPTAGAAASD